MPTQITRLIRLPELRKIVGVSTSTIYDWMNKGTFPKGVKVTRGTRAWPEDEVASWIQGHRASNGSG